MPYMMHLHFLLSLVTVKNKLFVIDDFTTHCEVFDNHSNKFVIFKEPHLFFPQLTETINIFSIGSKLVFFINRKKSVFTYDVLENEWRRKYLPSKMAGYTCVQVPWF